MAKKQLDDATKKRLRAGRMLLAGKRPAEAALAVGVARQTVYTWKGLLDEGGIDALRAVPGRGRPARLEPEQLDGLRKALLQNPTEHGFGTELWTLKRVGMSGCTVSSSAFVNVLVASRHATCFSSAGSNRSGLSQTLSANLQSRVGPDQRAGALAFASA